MDTVRSLTAALVRASGEQTFYRKLAMSRADAAALIGEYGIVDAAVAEKALPYCNIVCLTGADLLEALPGYLEVLYNASPAAVGGKMPDNSFYFA